jgi:hypothetical protein
MLIGVLVSQFSPHTIYLCNYFNQHVSEIDLLRSLFIENKIMDRLIIYTDDIQTDQVTRDGNEFRIYDVTAFM